MRLLVIGGDAAGMSAASQAKRVQPDTEVLVLEATGDVSYGACGLPYKLPDGQDMEDLQAVSAERFRTERQIDLRLGHRAQRLFVDEHKVCGVGPDGPFELSYDRLVIATGARAVVPPIAGLDGLLGQGVYPLKTLEDGRVLKRVLAEKRPARVAVIGGGYIGLEAAEGFAEQGLAVTIVEALPDILPFLPAVCRERVYAEAERVKVPILRNTQILGLARKGSGAIQLKLAQSTLEADLVLAATGVRPNSELAAEAGLALGAARSIAVDEHLYTSAVDILAAGDCADAVHGITGTSTWIPLALRANRAGKLAGDNALGGRQIAPPVMGSAVFKFFGLQIARTGLSEREAAEAGFEAISASVVASTRAHYIPGGGKLTVWLLAEKSTGKLLGGAMVGPESAAHRIDTLVAALHGGMTVRELYEMDLAYAPPFGPSWSPLLTCASQLAKQIRR